MGSSSSKQNAALSSPSPSASPSPSVSPSPSFVRRTRSYRRRVFQSPCLLRSRGNAVPPVSDIESKRRSAGHSCVNATTSDSSEMKMEHCSGAKVQPAEEVSSQILDAENGEWDNPRSGCMSSGVFSSRGQNPSSRFLSRLSIFPGNMSFRLNRANSFGSARSFRAAPTRFPTNTEEEPSTSSLNSGDNGVHNCDFFPTCFTSPSVTSPHAELATGNSLQNTSIQGTLQDRIHAGVDPGELSSSANHSSAEFIEERLAHRRNTAGETVEQNVRFSRSLSVGRLRERVLRRSSFLDLAFGPSEQGQENGYATRVGEEQEVGPPSSVENAIHSPAFSRRGGHARPGFIYGHQHSEVATQQSREARYHDLLEYRSNFLERRRRIRSQVRALQRLGSRFENLSGHERSCIMSGQHRRGHCTCRINPREINSNNETNARASISRIVMLAEALFEVLDEIHQQSVVLSSRSPMSSLGSAPAPIEVVESLPLRLYSKLQKHIQEEVAQ
ncbi:OLC1v1030767C1 [Oldenlandia corymbosa var. corymbosa]|nr:OLC1v1030767C1 [Oldenlandia corymbosa var. corymbosa]